MSGHVDGGILPLRGGSSQTERHSNRDTPGGPHAAGEPEPVGTEPGPDRELNLLLSASSHLPFTDTAASDILPPCHSCTSA